MAQITLSEKEVKAFAEFLQKHDIDQWFIAKDEGAYVGANSNGQSWLKYFKGCDPEKNQDWWETTRSKFGGDDFGEMLPTEFIADAAQKNAIVVLKLTQTRIDAELRY